MPPTMHSGLSFPCFPMMANYILLLSIPAPLPPPNSTMTLTIKNFWLFLKRLNLGDTIWKDPLCRLMSLRIIKIWNTFLRQSFLLDVKPAGQNIYPVLIWLSVSAPDAWVLSLMLSRDDGRSTRKGETGRTPA